MKKTTQLIIIAYAFLDERPKLQQLNTAIDKVLNDINSNKGFDGNKRNMLPSKTLLHT